MISLLGSTTGAYAHAYVVASDPQADGQLARSPSDVSIWFDEPIALDSAGAVAVRDERGGTLPCIPAARLAPNDATRVICRFSHPLRRGRYAVYWRVTSDDTHVVHGAFAFAVGESVSATAPSPIASVYDPSSLPAQSLRFLSLYGALVAIGALVFRATVAIGRGPVADRAVQRVTRVILAGLAIASIALVPALLVQSAAAAGTFPQHPLAAMAATIRRTPWGRAWLARAAGLAILGFAASRTTALATIAAVAGSIAVLASFSLSGHALESGSGNLLAANAAADFAHLCGAALWTGGVVAFAIALPRLDLVPAIARFSPIALGGVVAIVLSGAYAWFVRIGSWDGLFDNTYGLLVTAKSVLLIPLVVIGARNIARGSGRRPVAGFAREVGVEVALLSIVLVLSAILTGVSPPLTTMPHMPGMRE